MLQRELALRLVAEPGTRDYSSLTVLHRLAVDVSWELDLNAGCFFPPPKVASTFVRLRPWQRSSLAPGELANRRVASWDMSSEAVDRVYPRPSAAVSYLQNMSFDEPNELGRQVYPGFPLEVPRLDD